jgi:hypothetical protein
MNTKWLKAAVIRAVKTICQTAVAMIAVGTPIFDVDWKSVLAVSLTAGICSMLTSMAGLPEVPEVPDE